MTGARVRAILSERLALSERSESKDEATRPDGSATRRVPILPAGLSACLFPVACCLLPVAFLFGLTNGQPARYNYRAFGGPKAAGAHSERPVLVDRVPLIVRE